MTRVELVRSTAAPLAVRSFFEAGEPGPIHASLAQVPELLLAAAPLLRAIYGPSALPPRIKEIVVLRVSARMGCRYCVQTHTVVALGAGLDRAEVVALRGDAPAAEAFTDPGERALVRWAEVFASAAPVPAELIAELVAHHGDHGVVELSMVAGVTLMLNRYCTSLELPTSPANLARLEAEGLL